MPILNRSRNPGSGRTSGSHEKGKRTTSHEWKKWLQFIRDFETAEGRQPANPDPRPYVQTRILGEEYEALLDTGSMTTLIGRKIAMKLKSAGYPEKSTPVTILMANGAKSTARCAYDFTANLAGRETRIIAAVVPSLNCDMIVGMDLIKIHYGAPSGKIVVSPAPRRSNDEREGQDKEVVAPSRNAVGNSTIGANHVLPLSNKSRGGKRLKAQVLEEAKAYAPPDGLTWHDRLVKKRQGSKRVRVWNADGTFTRVNLNRLKHL